MGLLYFQASGLLVKNCKGFLPNTGQKPLNFDFEDPSGAEVTEVGAGPVETLKDSLSYRALGSRDAEIMGYIYEDSKFPGP